ncbi:MAG: hypothetical protein HY791_04430 [Deltaproteobacteria bacterium]|nr:hypothetical protein [Deltaproteobacteria bacterium]
MDGRKWTHHTLRGILAFAGLAACASVPEPRHAQAVAGSYLEQTPGVKSQGIGLDSIHRVLVDRSDRVRSPRPGVWHLSVEGVPVLIFAEESRVRILAPIFSFDRLDSSPDVERALLYRLLRANFDRAVDARYALLGRTVFASVTHTRASLGTRDLDRYLNQVVNLHKNTFRTGDRGYSSLPPEADSIEIDPREDDTLQEVPLEPNLMRPVPAQVL